MPAVPHSPPPRPPPPPALTDSHEAESELEKSMRALQLSSHAGRNLPSEDEDSVSSQYGILLKVADPQQRARTVPVHGLRFDMQKAWRQSYWAIAEVQRNLFLASFQTFDKRQFVWQNQPWSVGRARDTLLLELYDPRKKPTDYKFDTLYATVKFFGVPEELRKMEILEYLLNEVGQPSDLERIHPACLHKEENCITARTKLNITKPARDKVRIWKTHQNYVTVFVHYEKISRICTFCAGFFHTSNNCSVRQSRVHAASLAGDTDPIPFDVYGTWMTQIADIPMQQIQEQLRASALLGDNTSSLLRQLRLDFDALTTGDHEGQSSAHQTTAVRAPRAQANQLTLTGLPNQNTAAQLQQQQPDPMLQDIPVQEPQLPGNQVLDRGTRGKGILEGSPAAGITIHTHIQSAVQIPPPLGGPLNTAPQTALEPPQLLQPQLQLPLLQHGSESPQHPQAQLYPQGAPMAPPPPLLQIPQPTQSEPPPRARQPLDCSPTRSLPRCDTTTIPPRHGGRQRRSSRSVRRSLVFCREPAATASAQTLGQEQHQAPSRRRRRSPSQGPTKSDATSAVRGSEDRPRRRHRRWDDTTPHGGPGDVQPVHQQLPRGGSQPAAEGVPGTHGADVAIDLLCHSLGYPMGEIFHSIPGQSLLQAPYPIPHEYEPYQAGYVERMGGSSSTWRRDDPPRPLPVGVLDLRAHPQPLHRPPLDGDPALPPSSDALGLGAASSGERTQQLHHQAAAPAVKAPQAT